VSELLDELARTLAAPMPRRRALRTLGGALVAVAVPGAVRAQRAFGGVRRPAVSTGLCEKSCSDPFPVPCICPGPDPKYCFETCGEAGSTCCCLKGSDGKPSGAVACPPGTRCGRPGESNCPCVNTCGSRCCGKDEFCANPRENLCCKTGERGCGLECCKPNEECRTTRVGTGSSDICVKRCPPQQAWCGRDKCCPPKWRCVNEHTGLCKRCGRNEEECGKKCCDKRTSRCCGENLCCPKGRSCCTVNGKRVCCPANTKCAEQILPGDIGLTRGSPRVCCPKDRFHSSPDLCCPPGQKALSGPGLRVGPGLSPFCCPNDQVCGSTCCQKSDILGSETCCSGKCVDLRFDPQNCGRCGQVCSSGVCRDGICAFD